MPRKAARMVVFVSAIILLASCVALDRLDHSESASGAGHEDGLVCLPHDIGQWMANGDAIFIGTIIAANDVVVTPQAWYTTTETYSGIERFMTQAAGTAAANGMPVPPTVDGYSNEYPVTKYEVLIEEVYYDPHAVLGGDTITFEMWGHVADSATATAMPFNLHLVADCFSSDEEQYKPQQGERSLFMLSKLAGDDVRYSLPYIGRLDISGDHVSYYTNPPTTIVFHDRTLVADFLEDLRAEVASR